MNSMSRKKIILIGPAYPYRGGNALFVSYLYDALQKHFDIKLINYSLLYPTLLFPGTTQFDESKNVIKRAPSERLLNSINPFTWVRVASKIKAENPDLVIFDWWHPFFAPCHFAISKLLGKSFRNRILFITENVISHEAKGIETYLTKIGISKASAFLALSDTVVKELRAYSAGKPVFKSELPVYDCYDTVADEGPGILPGHWNAGDRVLLFFGYVRKYKGLDILLESMKSLVQKDARYRLLVVGEFYDSPKEYTGFTESEGLSESVHFINKFIPNEEVGRYYRLADVVVLPYRSATQSGILNVAYGFKKPVIVTDVGGLAEFVDHGKTGLIVKQAEANQIAEGIEHFYSLTDSVSFATEIEKKTGDNGFNRIPQTIDEIIEELKK